MSQARTRKLIAGFVVVVGLALTLPSFVSARPDSETVIACFHPRTRSITPEVHPRNCRVPGYKGKRFISIPIREMKWGHWGAKITRAGYGTDQLNGRSIRFIIYKRVTCEDGTRWYSQAIIVFPGIGRFFGIRLPTCVGGSRLNPTKGTA